VWSETDRNNGYSFVSCHVRQIGEGYAGFGGETSRKENTWKFRSRWEGDIKLNLQEVGWTAWTGLIWLRIGTGGGLLLIR